MSSTTLRIRGYRDKEPRVGQRQQQREIVMKSHLTSLTKAREGKKAKGGRGWRPAGDGGSLVVVAAVVVAVAVVVDVSLVVVIFFSTEKMTMRRYEGAQKGQRSAELETGRGQGFAGVKSRLYNASLCGLQSAVDVVDVVDVVDAGGCCDFSLMQGDDRSLAWPLTCSIT
ncbi:hypothetical protein GTR04_1025 [Trichophyton interdigitale]|uniref:Uncharacterized protein n=1 Tax=Trichophyton interdigitale TaxID=101480 RepID=A0A9P5D088_9EURO|nr:hypothetical protein GY631_0781 [Trichophyton interdigitale]KAF3900719.1 hypothetical protein GY632_0591 [Trichophyton interdigitale]KAG8211596.1 hypothetical protein GTR04_1025 [Trichophyton interdigitale]